MNIAFFAEFLLFLLEYLYPYRYIKYVDKIFQGDAIYVLLD